jgi:hypothetical protein
MSMTQTTIPDAFLAARNPVPDPDRALESARARIFAAVIAETPPVPRRRPIARRPLLRLAALGAPLALAIVAVSLLIGSGTPGASFPAAVANLAHDALQPGAVVHTVVTGDDVEGAAGARRETWATVDGSQIRYRTTQPDGSYTDVLLEVRGDRTDLTTYRSSNNTLYRYPPGTRDPASDPPASDLSITGIRHYAAAVDAGDAYVAGETTVDGTPAYQVVQKGPEQRPTDTQTWLVSKDPANPRLLEIRRPCPPASGPCDATTFHTYEITQDRAGLRFPDHADARVVDVAPPTATTP